MAHVEPQFVLLQMKLVKSGDFTVALETVVRTIHLAGEWYNCKAFLTRTVTPQSLLYVS